MKAGGNMKGYRLNKDIEYVKKIMQGIERKSRYSGKKRELTHQKNHKTI